VKNRRGFLIPRNEKPNRVPDHKKQKAAESAWFQGTRNRGFLFVRKEKPRWASDPEEQKPRRIPGLKKQETVEDSWS
jgi:hypothetical protein